MALKRRQRRVTAPDIAMHFVITKPSGHVIEVGKTTGKTLKGIKGNVTKTLAKRGYFKNKRKGHNGGWCVSKESPFWILRGRDVNYYRGKMGYLVCVYLIPDHLIDHLQ